jgi:hypothetical protein
MASFTTRNRLLPVLAAVVSLALLAACGGNYYQVTDTNSGKAYYTCDIDKDDGHVRFTDKATGDKVNLDSVEIREITREQYKNAVGK